MTISKELLLQLYEVMLTIRRFEEEAIRLFAEGMIPGFIHSCLGQEAVAAGVGRHLQVTDYILTTHRGHGHCIAKGADLKLMAAELLGRSTGYCGGRGGSMHIAAPDQGIMGANGIVGGGLPIAVGVAYGSQYQGGDRVTACFFGEGASNEGNFHEAMNAASLWNLPLVFVCENNGWAEFSPRPVHMKAEHVAPRAQAYDVPGVTVDGDDVVAVYQAAGEAIERARKGGGPTLVECMTHRWRGHYEGDPQRYRPAEELQQCPNFDPIPRLAARLQEEYAVGDTDLTATQEAVAERVKDAFEFAKNSPLPAPDAFLQGLYVSGGPER